MQPSVRLVSKTELARNTRQVIDAVLCGQTVVVEHRGQPQVAILDIVDYRILRAVLLYHARPPEIAPLAGLADERVTALSDPQERFDLVLAHYLAEAISLGRAAELLDIYRLDLQDRFARLDVPLRIGPATLEEARAEVAAIRSWFPDRRPKDKS
jgi:predicted HTH domain antitoxin